MRYWTPFGGFKQSGLGRELGPDAPERVHRGEERLHRPLTRPDEASDERKHTHGWTHRRQGRRRHRRVLGIGLATVARFVEEGARWSSATSTTPRAGAGRRLGGPTWRRSSHVDVTDKDQVDALFQTAKDTYGSVDIAFNNAGISPPEDDSILDTDLDAWRRVQEVNLTSVYLCCKAALPYMLEQGSGSIINTASFVAVMGAATSQISYSASKGGVLSMSRELGVQFAREGVRVNALCPGPVNTPLLQELFAKDAERAARRLVHVPMGRFGEPEEMANAVLFLASDESSFITATTFLVDGGISGAYVTRSEPRPRPLIGLTTYREEAAWGVWDQRADLLHAEYADAVVAAGGVPVLLRRVATSDARRPLGGGPPRRAGDLRWARRRPGALRRGAARADGGLATRPRRVGAGPARRGRGGGLPVLGVCRGMQVMAVDAGGLARPAHPRRGRPRGAQPRRRRVRRRSPCAPSPGSRWPPWSATRSRSAATTTSRCASTRACSRPPGPTTARSRRWKPPGDRFCPACSGTPRCP